MTAFWVGDVPAEDLLIAPARAPEDFIDLAPFTDVDLLLRAPDGTIIPAAGDLLGSIITDDDQKVIQIEWPATTPFVEQSGIYGLVITLLGAAGVSQRVAPVRLIVQADDGWYSLEEARDDWSGAPDDDAQLWRLLAGARLDVVTYDAPDLEDPEYDPAARPAANLREAQLAQARNRFDATITDPAGQQGLDGFSMKPFPLDWHVKQLIRPDSAIPVVF